MKLGIHTRTQSGRFRKERNDTLIGTLSKEYSPLKDINPRMKLGTLKARLDVDSLEKALKILRGK